jgi:hypothetical protein
MQDGHRREESGTESVLIGNLEQWRRILHHLILYLHNVIEDM